MGQFGNGITVDYDLTATLASATPTFVTLGEVYDVSGPSLSADALDATAHGDAWREFVGGLKDGGEVSLSVRMETGNATQLDLKDGLGELFLVRLRWPLGAAATTPLTCEFDCVLTGFEASGPHDDLLDLSITLKVSGEPEWTDEA